MHEIFMYKKKQFFYLVLSHITEGGQINHNYVIVKLTP